LGHRSHPADPFAAWYAPAGHAAQLPTVSDPVAFSEVPAGQASHAEDLAVAFEYVPAPHARQSDATLLLHVWHPWIVL
jgi:hypothetical protein